MLQVMAVLTREDGAVVQAAVEAAAAAARSPKCDHHRVQAAELTIRRS